MKTLQEINLNIAYITHYHEGVPVGYFQEINEAGDDWNEVLTNQIYQDYLLSL